LSVNDLFKSFSKSFSEPALLLLRKIFSNSSNQEIPDKQDSPSGATMTIKGGQTEVNGQTILVVEDTEADAAFLRYAFAKARIDNPIEVVKDGLEALSYLEGMGPYQDRAAYPPPIFILLDLKLPGMSGFEVLEWIRNNPRYQSVPVVIVTSSDKEEDRARSLALGANAYFVKSLRLEDLIGIVKAVGGFWVLQTPGEEDAARADI
jgi:CheY-like chemotaxis protein